MYKIVAGFHTGFCVWEGKESIMQSTLLFKYSREPSKSDSKIYCETVCLYLLCDDSVRSKRNCSLST